MMMAIAKTTDCCASCAALRIILSETTLVCSVIAQMADDVLDHDHSAVYDHSEIEGAQGEQVCGYVPEVQTD
jgi:hypothetical protein